MVKFEFQNEAKIEKKKREKTETKANLFRLCLENKVITRVP